MEVVARLYGNSLEALNHPRHESRHKDMRLLSFVDIHSCLDTFQIPEVFAIVYPRGSSVIIGGQMETFVWRARRLDKETLLD